VGEACGRFTFPNRYNFASLIETGETPPDVQAVAVVRRENGPSGFAESEIGLFRKGAELGYSQYVLAGHLPGYFGTRR
jgi:hypothetical protein